MMTVRQLLAKGCVLSDVSDTANLDTELLLCFCLDKSRSYLRARPDAKVSAVAVERFEALLSRRQQGEPVAYLTGERGFWSLDLSVNCSTLIPRPETELLVETVLDLLAESECARVLDLGTGTGAIALALACERSNWQLSACDNIPAAVALAQKNQRALGLRNVCVFESDWFEKIRPQTFDLIVSNPPYIDGNDPHLQLGDVRYEPRSALVAANGGLADIDHIIRQSNAFLSPQGWLVFEHGYDQAQAVGGLLLDNGFKNIFCYRDLADMERVSGGQWVP